MVLLFFRCVCMCVCRVIADRDSACSMLRLLLGDAILFHMHRWDIERATTVSVLSCPSVLTRRRLRKMLTHSKNVSYTQAKKRIRLVQVYNCVRPIYSTNFFDSRSDGLPLLLRQQLCFINSQISSQNVIQVCAQNDSQARKVFRINWNDDCFNQKRKLVYEIHK